MQVKPAAAAVTSAAAEPEAPSTALPYAPQQEVSAKPPPVLTPAPAAGLVWACIDVAAGHFSVLHPIHYLVESTILMCLNVSLGVPGVIIYS